MIFKYLTIFFIAYSSLALAKTEKAYFAGGCFWCVEKDLESLKGVNSVVSGYIGGKKEDAVYEKVSAGKTVHRESVAVEFDSSIISYEEILDKFMKTINPTDKNGQFVDRGFQYSPAIFPLNEDQKKAAKTAVELARKEKIYPQPITIEILDFKEFYPAEDYHQDYYKKNSLKYKYYRMRSGRDDYLDSIWKKNQSFYFYEKTGKSKKKVYKVPSKQELKKKLSKLSYEVTQEDATEPAFQNKYWDNKKPGIYVDIVSGEPLFSSKDKYRSGSGWPSFTRPLVEENIVTQLDFKILIPRTELRSKHANSHLGHVFNDGPAPTGKRYCINSAALEFIPVEQLEERGYGEFLGHFNSK